MSESTRTSGPPAPVPGRAGVPPPEGHPYRPPAAPVGQGFFTAVAEVEDLAGVDRILREIRDGIGHVEREKPFERITTLHFLRWAVIRPAAGQGDERCRTRLVLCTNHDGPLETHLAELVRHLGPRLRELYACCEGFEAGVGDPGLVRYLLGQRVRQAATFHGAAYHSIARIAAEKRLWDFLQEELDRLRDPSSAFHDRAGLRDHLRKAVCANDELKPLLEPEPLPRRVRLAEDLTLPRAVAGAGVALVAAGALVGAGASLLLGRSPLRGLWKGAAVAAGGAAAAAAGGSALALAFARSPRDAGPHEPVGDGCRPEGAEVEILEEAEDRVGQNQLTLVNVVRPGFIRWWALRATLAGIDLLSRVYYTPAGHLGELKTIHFAHWILLERPRQLVFFSNYDGSWESYLDAFVYHPTIRGLNAIWTHTVGYPRTRWAVEDGARADPEGFKRWARRWQVDTPVWYSAYPKVSAPAAGEPGHGKVRPDPLTARPRLPVAAVRRASEVRDGLARGTERWLDHL